MKMQRPALKRLQPVDSKALPLGWTPKAPVLQPISWKAFPICCKFAALFKNRAFPWKRGSRPVSLTLAKRPLSKEYAGYAAEFMQRMDSAGIPPEMQMYVMTNCGLYCRSSVILVEVKGKVGSQQRWIPPKCSDYDPFSVSSATLRRDLLLTLVRV